MSWNRDMASAPIGHRLSIACRVHIHRWIWTGIYNGPTSIDWAWRVA